MIELIVEGKWKMDLPMNIEISVVDENPMFLEDRIPAPYTLDFDVPATLNNLQAFGFPTRISSNIVKKKAAAELRSFGIVMGRGEVLLLEHQKAMKLQFKGSLEHENVSKDLNQLDVGEYNYGTVPSFLTHPYVAYNSFLYEEAYKNAMYQMAVNPTDFVVAPVKIKGVDDWESLPDFQGIKNAYRQYLNYWNTNGGFTFAEYSSIQDKFHTPLLPFPYLWKVIENGFGGQLQSNPFASGDLSKLVLISQIHKYLNINTLFKTNYSLPLLDQYAAAGNEQLKFAIKSFQQAYAFKSFLKNMLKIFSMTAFAGNKYSLEFNNDVFDRTTVTKLDDKLCSELIVNYEEAKDYRFSYADFGETDAENPTVGTTSQIFWLYKNLNQAFNTSFRDTNFGAVYDWKGEMTGVNSLLEMTSEIKRSALAVKKSGSNKEKYEVSSEVSPLDMNLHKCWKQYQNPVIKRHWFVPEIEIQSLDASPHIMFHGGMAQTFEWDGEYPYLMAHHTDHFGTKRLNTSLHPEGNGGLIDKFHGKFMQWVEKDKKRVKGSFKLTPLEIKNLNIRDKIHLKGRLFYIEKKEYTIRNKGVSLVEMELVEI